MVRLLISCLLFVGCTSEYERTYGESEAEYVERVSACSERAAADEYVLTLVDTDRWRVGAVPFWSTSERVRGDLGVPDSTFGGLPLASSPTLDYLVYERPEDRGSRVVAAVVNDSLAYLSDVRLGTQSLVTDRGRFERGAPLSEVREAFPETYGCRDMAGLGGSYQYHFSPVLVVTDTTRGTHVMLLFKDERLVGAGTDYYMQESKHRAGP